MTLNMLSRFNKGTDSQYRLITPEVYRSVGSVLGTLEEIAGSLSSELGNRSLPRKAAVITGPYYAA